MLFRFRQIRLHALTHFSLLCAIPILCGLLSFQQAQAEEFALETESMPLLRPGAAINGGPPEDWTNIVIKSCPKATRGDFKNMSRTDQSLTTRFRTVTLANISERNVDGQRRFQLSRIGLGVCVPVRGKGDILITPDTQSELGAGLGIIGRMVLGKIFAEFERVKIICRSDTSVVFDSPVIYHHQGENREMIIRYALIVDSKTGRLDTLAWLVEVDKTGRIVGVAGQVNWLPENMICGCELHVDSNQYSFGIPSKKAFGVVSVPKGEVQFAMPRHLESIAGAAKFDQDGAEKLISSFKKVIQYYDGKRKSRGK